ncbi:hypothetical protein V502_02136 [Pseudogymnoascus sp. VKM F-4520 (FW-2644)]|nr:hypothetical protein V502_02136 [Pseudogymnoascus sp. VKM F-4520 (FW-2644)]
MAETIHSFFGSVIPSTDTDTDKSTVMATQEKCEATWGIGISVNQLISLKVAIQTSGIEVPPTLYRAILCYGWRRSDESRDDFIHGIKAIVRVGGYLNELQQRLQEYRSVGGSPPAWLVNMMSRSIVVDLGLARDNLIVAETVVSYLTYSTPVDTERCTYNIMVMAGLVDAG